MVASSQILRFLKIVCFIQMTYTSNMYVPSKEYLSSAETDSEKCLGCLKFIVYATNIFPRLRNKMAISLGI